MNKWIAPVLLAIVCLFSASSYAAEISATLSTQFRTKYLGDNGDIFHKDPVLVTELFVALPHGFNFDIWHSVGLDGTTLSSDYGDEIDYGVGWSGAFKDAALDIGVTYFDLVDLWHMPRGDVVQPYGQISHNVAIHSSHTVSPYVRLELFYPTKGLFPERGVHLHAGVRHKWQVVSRVTLSQKLDVLFDGGAFGHDSGIRGRWVATCAVVIYGSTTIDASLVVSKLLTSPLSVSRKFRVVPGIGITARF